MSTTLYLNHAGTSWPKPEVVEKAVLSSLHEDPDDWPMSFQRAHSTIAGYFGVGNPDRLLLTPGCTSALALAIGSPGLGAGDRVITSGFEHHGMYRPLDQLRKHGVDLVVMDGRVPNGLDLEAFESALRQGGVKLVAMSAASNVTGQILPFKEVVALSREYGALTLLDLAQFAGWQEINLPELGVDLAAFAGHKALQAPWGIGGLYMSEGVPLEGIGGATCELKDRQAGVQCSKPKLSYCDSGSVDRLALLGLEAAVTWLLEPAQAGRLERVGRLAKQIEELFLNKAWVEVLRPRGERAYLPTIALRFPKMGHQEIAERFKRQGIIVSSGYQCAPVAHQTLGTQNDGVVRVSLGVGQGEEIVQRVALAVEKISSDLS